MSDIMLFGVLGMPFEMAMGDDLSRMQFWQRAQQAVTRIQSDADRIAELERQNAELRQQLAASADKTAATVQALQALYGAWDRDQYPGWENGAPNWHAAVAKAEAVLNNNPTAAPQPQAAQSEDSRKFEVLLRFFIRQVAKGGGFDPSSITENDINNAVEAIDAALAQSSEGKKP